MVDVAGLVDVTGLAAEQSGVVSRAQLIALGLTPGMIRSQVAAGRWRVLWPGVVATFTGPQPPMARVWAASLHAGRGALISGRSALWLAGAVDDLPAVVQVCVPHGRSVVAVSGVAITSSRRLAASPRPAARPARMAVDDALLDEVGRLRTAAAVVGLVLQVLQRRSTTPERLRAAVRSRGRLRWRALLLDLLDEAQDGVQSRLEYCYRRDVDVAHGLPRARRNERESTRSGPRYRDVRYSGHALVVELDGALAHPAQQAWRDRWRDNDLAVTGDRSLRYGWYEVAAMPCAVAGQVAAGLRAGGWRGRPVRCGPACRVDG